MEKDGLIHLYHGDGKGKTTASVGLAVRAAGAGLQVCFVQFLKDGTSNELAVLKSIAGITVVNAPPTEKFTFQMTPQEKSACGQQQCACLMELTNHLDGVDLLILDEVLHLVAGGMLTEEELLCFLNQKPKHLEVVLTGRNPTSAILAITDYCTEMKKQKHPFDDGVTARKGVEY